MCLRINSPATNRVGKGGRPSPAVHTLENRLSRNCQSISCASRTSGWPRSMMSSKAGRSRSL
jgi:hypothetical protein